jgi:hypothetical protein
MANATQMKQGDRINKVQIAVALLFGGVLALVGVLGPALAGSEGELIVFGRNYLHDAIHLLSGLAGVGAGYYAGGTYAAAYNKTLGAVYALVTVLGFVFFGFFVELIAYNTADHFLHLALALVFLAVGFGFSSRTTVG